MSTETIKSFLQDSQVSFEETLGVVFVRMMAEQFRFVGCSCSCGCGCVIKFVSWTLPHCGSSIKMWSLIGCK
ncbi:hypothetical protein L2E82_13255 [Cichorium intybus]|uniref:Uncharacterized protein n=1 Tax=Cichorium intybus TaxID=13427 RepID=A0ACB9GJL6_CICIN|nr:hypothetical protein L2E82_13255 [Cichorium intybus]